MLAVTLSPDIEARLDALARRTGRSKSFHAREAILKHIDELEALYALEERANLLAEECKRQSRLVKDDPLETETLDWLGKVRDDAGWR